MNKEALESNTLISTYRINRKIGGGGFGVVYKAFDNKLSRLVALKECFTEDIFIRLSDGSVQASSNANLQYYEEDIKRFFGEARLLSNISNNNVVRVFDVFRANGTAYMAMEYIEGYNLNQAIASATEAFSFDYLKSLMFDMFNALEAIHKESIFHRDLKPANIIQKIDSNTHVLIDFGAARVIRENNNASLTKMLTDEYAAPEQFYDDEPIGAWTDIYSLAVIFYKLITNRLPTDARIRAVQDKTLVLADNYSNLYDINFLKSIDKALSPKIEDRFVNIAQWRNYLNSADNESIKKQDEISKNIKSASTIAKSKSPRANSQKLPMNNILKICAIVLFLLSINLCFYDFLLGVLLFLVIFFICLLLIIKDKFLNNNIHTSINNVNSTIVAVKLLGFDTSTSINYNDKMVFDELDSFLIGRSSSADLVFENINSLSRNHCQISRNNMGNVEIVDLDSLNGVFINARKIVPNRAYILNDDDIIELGTYRAKIILEKN